MNIHRFHLGQIKLFTFAPIDRNSGDAGRVPLSSEDRDRQVARLASEIEDSSAGLETIAIDTTQENLEVLAPDDLRDHMTAFGTRNGFDVMISNPEARLYGDVLHGYVELLYSKISGVVWLVVLP